MGKWGLCADEFTDNGNWPHELYIREGRRMVGDFVMTERNLRGLDPTPEPVGLGSYNLDSHNTRRYVDASGHVRNEGNIEVSPGRVYGISYRAIVPKRAEASNLLAPVAVSASHIAYGSIRMEPVFMILGQSAGTAASLAIDGHLPVQKVDYPTLRTRLLADQQVLAWDGPRNPVSPAGDGPKGIEVTHEAAKQTGHWTASTAGDYLHDANEEKGAKSITFTPDLPADGTYDIYLRWGQNKNRATNVPIEIASEKGKETVKVNQRDKGGWVKVATGKFKAGKASSVTVSNKETDGFVIADAVRWVPK